MLVTCSACGREITIPDAMAGREVACRQCKAKFTVPDTRTCPFCAETIKIAARVCKHCGRTLEGDVPDRRERPKHQRQHVSPLVAVLLILFAALAVWFVVTQKPFRSPVRSDGRYVAPAPIGAPPPVVTRSEYERIREGMTYRQVVEIIGANGEEQSRSNLAGITTVMYSWMNANGSNMNAIFQNDQLVQKAQFGLP